MHWKTMLTFTLTLVFLSVLATESEWSKLRNKHHYKNLTDQKLIRVAGRHDIELFKRLLGPILKERVPDTPGIREVRDFIVNDLLKLNWHVDLDSFDEDTPFGLKNFVNIIATQNPSARRHLVIACHYDSKYMPGDQPFIGATDSAVPCAMMLHLAHQLNSSMNEESDVSLQLLFLDGEEAFVRWTAKDSLYGARHLAERWQNTPYPAGSDSTELDRIDMFILLDLIGAINPKFHNWFSSTSKHFQRLADTEQRLNKAQRNLRSNGDESLLMAPYRQNYFSRSLYHGDPYIEDDHIPFLRRNVPVIHLISAPFPPVWHTPADNESNLDYDTIQNLNTILRVFVTEYLHLQA